MTLRPVGLLTMTMFFIAQLFVLQSRAQDNRVRELSPVSAADFAPTSSSVNDSSGAVILADIGEVHFVGNEEGQQFSFEFQFHRRVKILNKRAFDDIANVLIPLYKPTDDPEKMEKIVETTFNLENGQVVEAKLDKKDIFEKHYRGEWNVVRFAAPAVKEGSIIDYTYTIKSSYYDFLRTWTFQSERYPCLWSELLVQIPQLFHYTVFKQGFHPYTLDKGDLTTASFRMGKGGGAGYVVDATVVRHHWIMKDIPPFQAEGFLFCPATYLDKVDFQLAGIKGDQYNEVFNGWKSVTERLMGRRYFGSMLDEDDDVITDCVKKAIASGGDFDAQAREIYYYLTNNFTCNDHRDIFISNQLRDVVKKQSGTVGDINLLMVAMLRKIGLKADPVVLTTRDEGIGLSNYPVIQRLNYVIVRLKMDNHVFFLDAAHPKLGFGQLDENCYNGPARIMSRTDSATINLDADSLNDQKVTVVFIDATGKSVQGTFESTLGNEESYDFRKHVRVLEKDKYFKDLQTQNGDDATISDGGIDSLDKRDQPVKVHFSFTLRTGDDPSKIYVNPFVAAGLKKNPLSAAERKYPIEMSYASDDLYVFTLQIPDGYTVEEMPKSTKAALNGGDGSFEYLIGAQNGTIQMRCRLKLNKANFGPEDYASLRDFYAMVVKKEAESIVLKKN